MDEIAKDRRGSVSLRRVAAQGAVSDYCRTHEFVIKQWYYGNPEDYNGEWRILVTDWPYKKNEYYAVKIRLLLRGIELISTIWNDFDLDYFAQEYVDMERRRRIREHTGGRPLFGFTKVNGTPVEVPGEIEVARLIVKLRDEGATYKEITEHPDVKRPDGRRFSISGIQVILKNKEKYK